MKLRSTWPLFVEGTCQQETNKSEKRISHQGSSYPPAKASAFRAMSSSMTTPALHSPQSFILFILTVIGVEIGLISRGLSGLNGENNVLIMILI